MKHLKLLLRFDDLCPTINNHNWHQAERICIENNIKPIIAVIPDNKDLLFNDNPMYDFWDRIKQLQQMGWCVGLHGLNHTFCSDEAGIMGITNNSEFVPKSFKEQDIMIRKGVEILKEQGICPELFVAPCHSFDNDTIKALHHNGINVISDGFYNNPVTVDDITYIPCRLWEKSKVPNKGFYTICCHPHVWTQDDIKYFEEKIKKNKDYFISVKDINCVKKITVRERFINRYRITVMKIKKNVKKVLEKIQ